MSDLFELTEEELAALARREQSAAPIDIRSSRVNPGVMAEVGCPVCGREACEDHLARIKIDPGAGDILGPTLDDMSALSSVAHHPTEDNVAGLFEVRHGDRLRFCKAWGRWLHYDGARWRMEQTDLALDFARALARAVNPQQKASVAKSGFARGVETFARAARCFATEPELWDADPWLLNTPVGVMDLRANEVRIHRRADYLTRITNVGPQRGQMPVFLRFLHDITCGDEALMNYHQRSLGATLSGAITDHWLLFWIGDGRNGKNTLGDLIVWILGDYAKVVPTETLMTSARGERHPTELANLRSLRLAASSEITEGSHWNESRIKSLTGDQGIAARYMRGDFFEFSRTHKHLVYGNHRPMLRVVDRAIRERLHVVPFRATFTQERGNCDPNLPEKLRAEAPAILAWLIDGHAQWLADGHLRKCPIVEQETADYFAAQSTIDMWLTERCEELPDLDTGRLTPAKRLYQDYSAWKRERGEEPMGQTRWGEWMGRRFGRVVNNGVRYRGLLLRAQ